MQKGNNVIRLFNTSAWMPDIDCMKLTLIEPSDDIHKPKVVKDHSTRIFSTTGGQITEDTSSLSHLPNGIYIANGRKILKR